MGDDPAQCPQCKTELAPLDDTQEPTTHGLCHPCAASALDEALEVLALFWMHGRALKSQNPTKLSSLTVISRAGSSYLVGGCFQSAIEVFEKYGRPGK